MKAGSGIINRIKLMVLIFAGAFANHTVAQTTMGILPVDYSGVSMSVLDARQWQTLAFQIQDNFITQLNGMGGVCRLSREHILLLLKEMPSTDPDNLEAEAYKSISKKEKLHYLLKCSIESLQVTEKNVLAPLRIIIVDGSNGELFWEKLVKTGRTVSSPSLNEQVLMKEVFEPLIKEISKEISTLKY
jgi:hypothetical protein